MTDVTVSDIKSQLTDLTYNPAGIQRTVLAALRTATDGDIEIVDPTNPVAFTLESAAVLTATAVAANATFNRRQYASVAQTPDDLYYHMSDRDYINRFATPASTVFSALIPLAELLSKLVLDATTGIKKVVIPRNTYFSVADTVWSLQYPIEIRQMAHGGLQVVYDATVASPLQTLTSNILSWDKRTGADGTEYLYFEFDVTQFNVISRTGTINSAQDYKLDVQLADQYYYTRVYVEDARGAWQEILTTHSDQIYDPATPTATLQVLGDTVTVRIPQIYTSSGLLNRGVRVDVYQTKGPVDLNLSNYPYTAFAASFVAYDKADLTGFVAPLKTIRTLMFYSNRYVSNGGSGLSFNQLRARVLQNATGSPNPPITNVQLGAALQDLGYGLVRNVDTITNRTFLATRTMPTPSDERLITAAAASIETAAVKLQDLVVLSSVIDNGQSVTLTPDTLWQITAGVVQPVPSVQVQSLLTLPASERASQVTQGGYLYTPFHYVLDDSGNEFAMRPYYLTAPVVQTKVFVASNDSALLEVGTSAYGIELTPTGYRITIALQSGDGWKALPDASCFVLLAYVPQGEQSRAYLMGALTGLNSAGERVYTFDLSSTFNIDANDGLELTKFTMFSTDARITKSSLLQDFDVIFATSAVMPSSYAPNAVDAVLPRYMLPTRVAGVMHESLKVQFGKSLSTLWSRARSVISTITYKTYATDVPRFYQEDVYQTNPTTGAIFGVDGQGNLTYTVLHHQGDPVLDGQGNPVYQFRQGDVMLDPSGNPIPLNPRGMMRQIDLMLIEGAYWFATDSVTTTYRTNLVGTVVEWLTNDLETIGENLLEQTRIYFYPKTTLGSIDVMIQNGVSTTIAAGQAFNVTLYVSSDVYANDSLRAQLSTITVQTLSAQLDNGTVAVSAMLAALRQVYGDDVIDVELTGLGGAADLPVLTLLNNGDRCSIRKRLIAQADNTLAVQEDVTLNFVRHALAT